MQMIIFILEVTHIHQNIYYGFINYPHNNTSSLILLIQIITFSFAHKTD